MGSILGAVKGLFLFFRPPEGADREETLWRYKVLTAFGSASVLYAFHVAWACGYLVAIGLPGFAMASDVGKLIVEVRTTQEFLLSRELEENIKKQCRAQETENREALLYATRTIRDLKHQYEEVTGRRYEPPTCKELI